MYSFDTVMLSGLFERDKEREILSNSIGNVQMAANELQWSIVSGMDSWLDKPLKLINAIHIGSYPARYRLKHIPAYEWSHSPGAHDINVGFNNLSGYKQLSRTVQITKCATKWASENNGNKVMLIYSAQSTLLFSAMRAKKKNPDLKTILIVPDLPQCMTLSKDVGMLRKCVEAVDLRIFNMLLKYIDAYVLLTGQMSASLDASKPFIVVEGIARDSGASTQKQYDGQEKIILYTGTLTIKYGVLNLLDAMKYIKSPDIRLVICGEGEGRKQIIEASKSDSRIQYRGLLTHEEAVGLQRKATVLVNPRQNDGIYTKFSFPSKLLEYLSSGTPVLAYKLDGIPGEYDSCITYIPDNSVAALAETIERICDLPPEERKRIGENAREFVLREKNPVKQTQKIVELIKSLSLY